MQTSPMDGAIWLDDKWIYGGAALASVNKECPKDWRVVKDIGYYFVQQDKKFVTLYTTLEGAQRAIKCVNSCLPA